MNDKAIENFCHLLKFVTDFSKTQTTVILQNHSTIFYRMLQRLNKLCDKAVDSCPFCFSS